MPISEFPVEARVCPRGTPVCLVHMNEQTLLQEDGGLSRRDRVMPISECFLEARVLGAPFVSFIRMSKRYVRKMRLYRRDRVMPVSECSLEARVSSGPPVCLVHLNEQTLRSEDAPR